MDSKMQEQATNTMIEIRRDIHERLSHEKREIEGIEFYSTFKMTGDRMNLEKNNIYKVKIKDDVKKKNNNSYMSFMMKIGI